MRLPDHISKAIAAATLASTIPLGACKPAAQIQQHIGATGVCFSHLSAVNEGMIDSFHQVILVRSSGDLAKDIRRIKAFSADRYLSRNPHTIPTVWHSAWLEDQRFDGTAGPNCASLPMIKR